MIFRSIESLEKRNELFFCGGSRFSGCGYARLDGGILKVVDIFEGREVRPYLDDNLDTKNADLPWVDWEALEEDGESTIYFFRGEKYRGYALDCSAGQVSYLCDGGVKEYVIYRGNGVIGELEIPFRSDGTQSYTFSPDGSVERFALYWDRRNERFRRIMFRASQVAPGGQYGGVFLVLEEASLSDLILLDDNLFSKGITLQSVVEAAIHNAGSCEKIYLSGEGISEEILQKVFSEESMPRLTGLTLSNLDWNLTQISLLKKCPSLRRCKLSDTRPEFKQRCEEFALSIARELKKYSPQLKVYCFGQKVEG